MLNSILGKKQEKSSEFMDLVTKAYFHIQHRQFNKALELYNDIYKKYRKP